MHFISHRGNISGPNPKLENSVDYIELAIKNGFEVEVDIWFKNNDFYLGHDSPLYKIEKNFLKRDKIWCHAKNFKAFDNLIEIPSILINAIYIFDYNT